MVTQLVGATLACLFLLAVLGNAGGLGATQPGPGIHGWQALLIEVILTLGLVSTILGTASAAQNVGPLSALAVGAYIVLAGLWASPISGASMNPARSFGPELVGLNFANFWIYVIGPIAGAVLAVGIAFVLRVPAERIPPQQPPPRVRSRRAEAGGIGRRICCCDALTFVTDEPAPRGDYAPTIRNDVHAIPTKSKTRALVVIPTNCPQDHSKSNSALIEK